MRELGAFSYSRASDPGQFPVLAGVFLAELNSLREATSLCVWVVPATTLRWQPGARAPVAFPTLSTGAAMPFMWCKTPSLILGVAR
jgi:hypothetical protein